MSIRLALATTKRVLQQLRHDYRSLALILIVPTILLTVLNFVFDDKPMLFNGIAPLLVGLIPFTIMFIVTSVAMLRERTSGTLERLLVSRLSKLDLLIGYAVAFGVLAVLQAGLATFVTLYFLEVQIFGDISSLILIAVVSGICGMSLGLFFSAFAKNEFQAVQFMPAFVLPQFLVCGLFVPREQMMDGLHYASNLMPLSYVVDGMRAVQQNVSWTGELTKDFAILAGFTVVALVLGAISLRTD